MNGCCESKSWALSERDLNKFIMKDATMRCVLSRSVASKTDTEGCISFTCIANKRYAPYKSIFFPSKREPQIPHKKHK